MFRLLGMTMLSLGILGCGGGSDDSGSGFNEPNLPPSISNPAALLIREGSLSVLNIDANDSNGDKLTYEISGGEDQSSFTISPSGLLAFVNVPDFEVPADADGDNVYVVSVHVSDGSLSVTQQLRISIADAFEGRVVFAPMSGATVFVDINGNGRQDENEPSGVTDDDGFFRTALFNMSEDSPTRVVSMGGMDTTTNQQMPQLALVSEIPVDKSAVVQVTATTTLLSSVDGDESKRALLAGLGIDRSWGDMLTSDGWSVLAVGDPLAMVRQRLNRQVGLFQQGAVAIATAQGNLSDQLVPVVQAFSRAMAEAARSERAIDLASHAFIEDVLREALTAVAPTSQADGPTLAALAGSIAMVNAVTADPALDPRSDVARHIAKVSQSVLLGAVSELASGGISVEEFRSRSTPAQLFVAVPLPVDALDSDLDGLADLIDSDNDGDGVNDGQDRFPLNPRESQDSDDDGIGNNADPDDDNDGIDDNSDVFALIPVGTSPDLDADGWPDECGLECQAAGMTADPDDDNDGVTDANDAYPTVSLGLRVDTDSDGWPNECDASCQSTGMTADPDDDNDGVNDDVDPMPMDKRVHTLPTTTSQQLEVALLPKARNVLTGRLGSTSQDNRPVTYRITTQAVFGTARLTDAITGTFEYTTTEDTVQSDSFSYIVNDGYVDSMPSTVSLSLLTDPLYKHQWHLANTGQENFANAGGRIGADMNVSEAIAAGFSGQGVVVAVVDTGLEIAHVDLVDNVVAGSYDFVEADSDPTRKGSGADHGTAVAGIAGARGWNGLGLRGVAPRVSLKGYNWLISQSTANWVSTFGGESYSEDVDIFNNSWGSAPRKIDDPMKDTEETTFNETLPAMRDGKGAIFVKSAGNYFNRDSNGMCGSANGDGGLSCRDVNQDTTHNNANIIVVGALNADGTRSSYSTVGSAIWVSAPGGESGSSGFGGKPAIMTTDVQGCTKGYVGGLGDGANQFNSTSSPHVENTNCNYTSTMNGTSSAAPNASGAIALMLEANPQLTMRDVKHILAKTSRQVDATIAPVVLDGIAYHEWVTNAAGFTYHNYYGFGGIDVGAAVDAATVYTLGSLGDRSRADWISSGTSDLQVGFGATVTQTVKVPTSGVVEYVLVRLTMTHEDPSEVGFRLTSPSGTTTTIWQPYVAASTAITSKVAYLSASAFYGESMSGDWTLSAYDHKSGQPMTLHSFEIKIEHRKN